MITCLMGQNDKPSPKTNGTSKIGDLQALAHKHFHASIMIVAQPPKRGARGPLNHVAVAVGVLE